MNVLNKPTEKDVYYMNMALQEAETAFKNGEIPIGAVVVMRETIIARAHNQVELLRDPTAHAELLALSAATHYLGAKYLIHASIYVSVEPCIMCFGAIKNARISRLVWGANEPKFGITNFLNPSEIFKGAICSGVLSETATELMHSFFKTIRK